MNGHEELNFNVKVIVLQEDTKWVAQCLDYDIAAHGSSMREAINVFTKTFAGQVALDIKHGKEPLQNFTKAPVEYWDKYEAADFRAEPKAIGLPKFPATSFPFNIQTIGVAQAAVFA